MSQRYNITMEELQEAWGKDVFDYCFKEAQVIRAKVCPDWAGIIPPDLVLAVAIQDVFKRLLESVKFSSESLD